MNYARLMFELELSILARPHWLANKSEFWVVGENVLKAGPSFFVSSVDRVPISVF